MSDQPREPTLHGLLNQFENIGGPEVYGPEGIALLIALWRKSAKLGWKESYTMTNTEITVQTGIKSRETINSYRNKLVRDGLIQYKPPPRGQSRGDYKMNFHFNDIQPVQEMDQLTKAVGEPVQEMDHFAKAAGEPVQNMDYLDGVDTKPVHKMDHLADTVLKDFKILIDRLIDEFEDDERLKFSAGVLTTVGASMPVKEIALYDEDAIGKRAVRIENHFNNRKGRLHGSPNDWEHVHSLAKEPIPEEFIYFAIDLAFARHRKTKKDPRAEINLFSYCRKVIDSVWFQLQIDLKAMSQTTPVPSGTVSLGQNRVTYRKSKHELEMEELRQAKEEAKRLEGIGSD
ncbi:hypothetical protein [Paenibacillus radicis (ex Xue et al. 2023)]|uniref:Uncharacterized protein n=1 Tax=Paenibacillus radicis (ex Xue et al. 2023) TaxID=2972489 RepID=A0ABT1YRH3_9BACL|nr:hypothetical protein [Paenibacillus radicis (ex Xue et al. 2023)]MCR8635770.1 hypothetical protein [Paenibacillus radicis (ex Xue et al. 2023)]